MSVHYIIKAKILSILCILPLFCFSQTSRFTLSGYVREEKSSELLIGVNVFIPELKTGTQSNTYGFYSITMPAGSYQVVYSYVGYTPDTLNILLDKSQTHNVDLLSSLMLTAVEIRASAEKRISQEVQMSNIEIPIQQIRKLPAFMGERDIFKTLTLMPGVQKGSEGSSGVYVRGGGPDQNLIILDDANVYNASHLFGFFSIFNGDAIKSVELIKGGFPAHYGGRLSSVIELNMKDGNKKKMEGEAGIGLISSRFTLEGPLVKEKSSFLISARRTYLDVLIRPFQNLKNGVGGYYFYDLNAKANWDFSDKNKLYLSGYFGRDKFHTRSRYTSEKGIITLKDGFYWQNATSTLRWNHLFSNKTFCNTSLIFSNYNMVLYAEDKDDSAYFYNFNLLSGIRDFSLKSDFSYYPNSNHHIRYGGLVTQHRFKPSATTVKTSMPEQSRKDITKIDVEEAGLYLEDEARFGKHLRLNPGLRFTGFVTEKKSYFAAEPRLNSSYTLDDRHSFKASFAMMNQCIHLLSNTGLGLPTDLWVPSSENIKPQQSLQIAMGYAQDIPRFNLNFSIETYYKWMNHIIGYREGATFLLYNQPRSADKLNWEDNVTVGKGYSTGIEFLLQRKTGRLSGWIGYTLSWTKQQFDELNFGKEFYAGSDRRHDLSIVAIYEINKRITISGTWVFSSGKAATIPTGTYTATLGSDPNDHYSLHQAFLTDYGEKNSFRMPDYHRLDLNIQFHKKIRKGLRTFEIGLYNAYNRRNPFYYFLDYEEIDDQRRNVLKAVSLFPVIPSFTYSIKF